MSDENSLSGTDDFKNLQKRLNHESIRNQFRLKLVGGLNQDDVTAYIEDIEDKFHKLEQENKNVSDNIYSIKKRLNEELEDKDNLQVSLNKTQNNLDTYIAECENKELIIQSLNEKSSSKTTQLQNEIHQISEERKELETLLSESSMKIEHMNEYASGFEKENSAMKARIVDLEKGNSEISQLQNEINQMTEERKALENILSMSGLKIEQMAEDKKELEELLTESGSEIEQMKKCAAVFEKDNNEMKTRIVDLEKEISHKNIQNYEINRTCHNLEQQIDLEKSCNEKQSMDLAMFRQNIARLEITISENLTEIKELKKLSLKAEQELNLEKARVLNYKIYGFKEEFSSIYEKIENLADEADHQVKTNNELQQQLIIEQLRSDKAENDLKSFIKLLNGLKDKVSSEQNPFETQLKEITEKRYQLQPEINDWLIKLQ